MSLAESELIAASLITLGIVFYAVFRWRAAPAAFRAILAVSLSGFAAGVVTSPPVLSKSPSKKFLSCKSATLAVIFCFTSQVKFWSIRENVH
jgi:hypothetical protein